MMNTLQQLCVLIIAFLGGIGLCTRAEHVRQHEIIWDARSDYLFRKLTEAQGKMSDTLLNENMDEFAAWFSQYVEAQTRLDKEYNFPMHVRSRDGSYVREGCIEGIPLTPVRGQVVTV